ncbi:hypothetical protein Taro_035074 [Colocasia esculenta]|uniref:Uncharacterized protein n=1 Tax=Colocasia esculenta TaxID=4460 RepID=A0A843WHH9_COLES|nr:hypothetical protein [Colocasia esculenta]
MAAACRSSGSQLTSALRKRRSPRSRSCRDGGAHRDPNRCAFFKRVLAGQSWGKLCSAQEELLHGFLGNSRSWWSSRHVLAVSTSRGAGETSRELRFLRSSRRCMALVSGALASIALLERVTVLLTYDLLSHGDVRYDSWAVRF